MRNPHKRVCIIAGVLLLTIGMFPTTAQAQECNAILQYGIFDTIDLQDESQVTKTFFNWMRQQSSSKTQTASDSRFGLSAVLDFIPIKLGTSDRRSNLQAWSYEAERWVNESEQRRSNLSIKIRKANPDIITAWERCMNGPGFKLSLFSTYDPHEFRLKLKFNPIGTLLSATLDDDPAIPSSISCRPGSLRNGLVIDHNGKEYSCRRSSDDPATIILNSNVGPQSVSLTEILPAPTLVSVSLSSSFVLKTVSGSYPTATVTIGSGVLLGGGCAVTYRDTGSVHALVMVNSMPSSSRSWQCKGADPPNIPVTGAATATAISLDANPSRASVKLESITHSQASARGKYPEVIVGLSESEVEKGYVLVSGGCASGHVGNGADHATPIVISEPVDMRGWKCKGADPPGIPLDTTVTAYLVAVRLVDTAPSPLFILPKLESKLFVGTESFGLYPRSEAAVENDYIVSGGGCNLSYHDKGSEHAEFAVSNTLQSNKWICQGADPPNISNPAKAQSFAIGVRVAP
jgi:hypothetical protein